jgi:hypothetical protein
MMQQRGPAGLQWVVECCCCRRDQRGDDRAALIKRLTESGWAHGDYNGRHMFICDWCLAEAATGKNGVRVGNWREDAA